METTARESVEELEGKYLTFILAEEEYGLEITKVIEIIGMMSFNALPQTPDFVKGVINLRGKVIPILDLRLKFDMLEAEHTEKTCIIVVEIKQDEEKVQMGIIVDSVSEVLNVTSDDLEETPKFGVTLNTDFILAMAKGKGIVRTLLDIDGVLSSSEVDMLAANVA